MRAKQMIQEFSKLTGLPVESVTVADRALADANLRSKGRGPKPPDVTMEDAIRLLLGILGSPALSKADIYAADASRFEVYNMSTEAFEGANVDFVMRSLLGFDSQNARSLSLIDAIASICAALSRPEYEGIGRSPTVSVWLHIPVNGPVEITFSEHGHEGRIYYSGVLDSWSPPLVERLARVSPEVLRWIGLHFERADKAAA